MKKKIKRKKHRTLVFFFSQQCRNPLLSLGHSWAGHAHDEENQPPSVSLLKNSLLAVISWNPDTSSLPRKKPLGPNSDSSSYTSNIQQLELCASSSSSSSTGTTVRLLSCISYPSCTGRRVHLQQTIFSVLHREKATTRAATLSSVVVFTSHPPFKVASSSAPSIHNQ
jgi:hypothetical protein